MVFCARMIGNSMILAGLVMNEAIMLMSPPKS
jgi:hypothetical protein